MPFRGSCARRPSRYKLAEQALREARSGTTWIKEESDQVEDRPRAAPLEDDLDLARRARERSPTSYRSSARTARSSAGGCGRSASTGKPGLRALMARRARRPRPRGRACDRLAGGAPRLNAAGHLGSRCAASSCCSAEVLHRASQVAEELDRANSERRSVEDGDSLRGRSADRGEAGAGRAAYVLSGEDWHPGVIGIVAARLAEDPTGGRS